MRILGVDPGLTRCGLGVIDVEGGRRVSFVCAGVLRSPAEMAPHKRLMMIADGLDEAISRFRPEVVAVERVFAEANVRSVTGTAQVVGVVMLAAARAGLALGMHSPSEVKAAVTGSGRADKRQVQLMIQRILGLAQPPRPADAADALAIGIAHAWRGGAHPAKAEPDRAQHGGAGTLPRADGADLTAAQKIWAGAERMSKRHGATAPRKAAGTNAVAIKASKAGKAAESRAAAGNAGKAAASKAISGNTAAAKAAASRAATSKAASKAATSRAAANHTAPSSPPSKTAKPAAPKSPEDV